MTQTRWNLQHYTERFGTAAQRDAEVQRLRTLTETFVARWRDVIGECRDTAMLAEALTAYEQWEEECANAGALGYYAWLRMQEDSTDMDAKMLSAQMDKVAVELANQVQFFSLAIGMYPAEMQTQCLHSDELRPFHQYLRRLWEMSAHQLSEAEEKILNLTANTSYSRWVDLLSERLDQEVRVVEVGGGETQEKTFNDLFGLIQHTDEVVRESAATAINEVLEHYAPIAEAEINAVFAYKQVEDELRHFTRPDASRHMSDDIESAVVDGMIQSVSSYNHIPQRYYALKAALMHKSQLRYHERGVPFGTLQSTFSYDESVSLVSDVLSGLDTEFGEIFQRFIAEGRVDVFPRVGKAGGAFCVYWNRREPVHVLLNHTDRISDVLTLAHEMGHGIHDELMRIAQSQLYFHTSLATAEVASTFMEDFVLEALLKRADKQTAFALLLKRLDDDVATIHRQVACYRFEQALHEKMRAQGYVPLAEIGVLFSQYMSEYMGDAVEQPPSSHLWWVYWSHIRRFFYVYSYASGLLISKSLQAMVRADSTQINNVKSVLRAGASASPRQLFADIGIDIAVPTFYDGGLKQMEQSLLDAERLAKELGYIV